MNFAKTLDVSGRLIGEGQPCFVIAEAGVSHFGRYDKALKLVDLAVEAKADAIKFQVFDVDQMISGSSEEWKFRMRGRSLAYDQYASLQEYCRKAGIIFFATAHDIPSFKFLEQISIPLHKIGSGELFNWSYIAMVASAGKPVILSTGMSSLEDVVDTVRLFGESGNEQIAVLHCVTSYPTPFKDVNLKAIDVLRSKLDVIVGYSDHTAGYHVPLASVALGASIVEKHISLDFDLEDAQDWKVSCGPHNLKDFIEHLRDIEQSLGNGIKVPTSIEMSNREWALKSLVYRCDVEVGEIIRPEILDVKRPGTGIAPNKIEVVVGRRLAGSQKADTVLEWEHFE
jgi:N-acetylneuraminate synthase/N,N'-diacetyllegionaminate synthase